jgi:hypothetical protein
MLISAILILFVTLGGLALTYLIDRDESMLWRVCAGTVVGQCVFGTLLFLLTFALGLSYVSIIVAALVSAAPVLLLRKKSIRTMFDHDRAKALGKLNGGSTRKFLPFIYYAGFFVFFVLFFDRAMMIMPDGIYTGGSNNLGDLPFHLGIIYSFTDGANFPPQNPSFSGAKFAYPFIADLCAAAMMRLGSGVREAMLVQNVSWAFALLVVLERFVFKLSGDKLAARIAPFLLFLSGGIGFLWFFSDIGAQSKNIFQLLMDIGKDYTISDKFRWGNSLITLFLTQRSILLGMPLTLVAVGGLWKIFSQRNVAADDKSVKITELLPEFVLGLIAGMLPLVHLHSLFVLFVVAFLLLIMRTATWREMFAFGLGVGIIATPELLWSITGSATRASEFFSFYFGWESAQSNIVWAWLKNTGLFIPLLLIGLYLTKRTFQPKVEPKTKKQTEKTAAAAPDSSLFLFYLPFAFLFILANLVKLAPWEWDNIKVLIYWFIGSLPFVCIVLTRIWREKGAARIVSLILIFVLTASGALDVWRTVSRQINYRVFDPDGIKIAERLRSATPPDSVFLNAPTYNSSVVLTGRLSVMRYPGHLGSHGINYAEREQDVKEIYRGGPTALSLFAKYGIDYVLISPEERNALTPNETYFSHFPVAAELGQYKVYDVRPRDSSN